MSTTNLSYCVISNNNPKYLFLFIIPKVCQFLGILRVMQNKRKGNFLGVSRLMWNMMTNSTSFHLPANPLSGRVEPLAILDELKSRGPSTCHLCVLLSVLDPLLLQMCLKTSGKIINCRFKFLISVTEQGALERLPRRVTMTSVVQAWPMIQKWQVNRLTKICYISNPVLGKRISKAAASTAQWQSFRFQSGRSRVRTHIMPKMYNIRKPVNSFARRLTTRRHRWPLFSYPCGDEFHQE